MMIFGNILIISYSPIEKNFNFKMWELDIDTNDHKLIEVFTNEDINFLRYYNISDEYFCFKTEIDMTLAKLII